MAQVKHGIRQLLAIPVVYDILQWLVRAPKAHRKFVREFVRPFAGQRVLDIGCGTATIFRYLQDTEYYGIDLSLEYIEKAKKSYAPYHRFYCVDVKSIHGLFPELRFDIILAFGVLHHLDDHEVDSLCAYIAETMTPEGRFVTYDETFVEGQSFFSRLATRLDRGKNIRTPEAYAALLEKHFDLTILVTDEYLFPFVHTIIEANNRKNDICPGSVTRAQ